MLRRKVNFGPSHNSEKPVADDCVEPPSGLNDEPPSLFMTNDQRSDSAKRNCVPKNSVLPPRNTGLEFGIVWYRKIGRASVSARGSSNRNGLLTGEAKQSK